MYVSLGIFTQYRRELMGVATVLILLCHSLLPPRHTLSERHTAMDHNHRQPRSRYLPVSIRIGHVPLPTQNDQMESGGNSVVCKKIQAIFTTLSTHLLPLLPGIGLCKRRTFFHFYIFIPPFHIELLVEHKGFWYIAMLIPLYFLTPFYARIIDKTKYQTLLTVTFMHHLTVNQYHQNRKQQFVFACME